MSDKRTIRLLVSGRVQGVGFRWFARREAQELGIAGWVRNLPDGRVEALAAGEPAAVATFVDRLRHGPPGSSVAGVEEEPAVPSDRDGFDILR